MIDWARVNALRDEIGAADFAEVVTLFLEEADEVVSRLSNLLGAPRLEADLHFLKGAALNLGFADFASLCQIGERRAAQGDASADLQEIRHSYAASKTAFDRGLATPGPRSAAG